MEIKGNYANASLALSQGIVVDLSKRCFTKFTRLFHLIKFKDACKPLPKADYVLLFKTFYNKCQSCSVQDFEDSSVVQLSIVYDKNKKLIVNESNDLEAQKQLATQLASELHVRIKDGATDRRHPHWL